MLIPSDFFVRLKKEDMSIVDRVTDYQIETIFGSCGNTRYEDDEFVYYKQLIHVINVDDLKGVQKYVPSMIPSYDSEADAYVSKFTIADCNEEEIAVNFQHKMEQVRIQRDVILSESDIESKILLVDFWNAQSDEYKNAWLNYRQALRDIPQTFENPYDVVWPTKPTE